MWTVPGRQHATHGQTASHHRPSTNLEQVTFFKFQGSQNEEFCSGILILKLIKHRNINPRLLVSELISGHLLNMMSFAHNLTPQK